MLDQSFVKHTRGEPQVRNSGLSSGGENFQIEALNFYPIFIPLDECKVSGVPSQAD
jgi:hypothetical protein